MLLTILCNRHSFLQPAMSVCACNCLPYLPIVKCFDFLYNLDEIVEFKGP